MSDITDSSSSSSSSSSSGSCVRRSQVARLLVQRVGIGRIAAALDVGVDVVRADVESILSDWRRERSGVVGAIGDTSLRTMDRDESDLRLMAEKAKGEGQLSTYLQLMKLILQVQDRRLKLAGYDTDEGKANFASPGSGEGVGGLLVSSDEIEGWGVGENDPLEEVLSGGETGDCD